MLKTLNKRSGISSQDENPSPYDKPADAFVLNFGYSKLFRISDFEFRISNLSILGSLCAFARVIFLLICNLKFDEQL